MAAIIITGFASCEEEQDLIYVTPAASFQILTPQSGEGVVLTAETANNPGLVLSWEDMDYGTDTAINYTVQVAANGSDFSAPVSLASTGSTYATITASALNTAALGLGLEPGVEGAIDVRVMSTVGTQDGQAAYSNTITYLVTPYQTAVGVQDFFLVGDATDAGWENNNNNVPLFRDPEATNMYYYTGYFNAGAFKFLAAKGEWHPQYGAASDGVLGASGADGSNEPGTINVATAGYYTFTADTDAMTYTFTAYEAGAGAPTYPSMGFIGSATPGGWDADTDMTVSAINPHLWHANGATLVDGEMKFREGDAWDNSWGDTTPISGQGQNANDGNIPVTTGTYDIWFNDLDGRYILIPVN